MPGAMAACQMLFPPLLDDLASQCLRIQMGMSGRSIFGAAGWMDGWGAAAEVVGPADLRASVRQTAAALARLYAE